jgi:hypothetical protein
MIHSLNNKRGIMGAPQSTRELPGSFHALRLLCRITFEPAGAGECAALRHRFVPSRKSSNPLQ